MRKRVSILQSPIGECFCMPRSTDDKRKVEHPPSIRYIPCQAEPGMFRDELLVFLRALNPDKRGESIKVQMLVDQSEVTNLNATPKRNKPANGWLRVTLAKEQDRIAEIVLPQPAQPVG